MTRTTPSPGLTLPPADARPGVWLVLFHFVGLVVGAGMTALVVHQLAGIGGGLITGSPLVHDVLALDASLTGAGGAASGSGVSLLSVAALVCATAAASCLLAGSVAALWVDHRRAAHRLTTLGLWLALGVCLAAMLPAVGYPFGAPATAGAGPDGFEWHPAPKAVAVAAAAGLLLASITADRRRAEAVHS